MALCCPNFPWRFCLQAGGPTSMSTSRPSCTADVRYWLVHFSEHGAHADLRTRGLDPDSSTNLPETSAVAPSSASAIPELPMAEVPHGSSYAKTGGHWSQGVGCGHVIQLDIYRNNCKTLVSNVSNSFFDQLKLIDWHWRYVKVCEGLKEGTIK